MSSGLPLEVVLKLLEQGLNPKSEVNLSELLEECLRNFNGKTELPNFPQVAMVLEHSTTIYGRSVDSLSKLVYDIVFNLNKNNESEVTEEGTATSKRQKKSAEISEFELINLEEGSNINMKESQEFKSISLLPKAFIQFEPRIMDEKDVKIFDYEGDLIGLMADFRVNWNMDENFMLCHDMDFCKPKNSQTTCNSSQSQSAESRVEDFVPSPMVDHDFGVDEPEEGLEAPKDLTSNELCDIIGANTSDVILPVVTQPECPPSTPDATILMNQKRKDAETPKSKKRKFPFELEVADKIPAKFSAVSNLTGTSGSIDKSMSDFELPFTCKIVNGWMQQKNRLKRFIDSLYTSDKLDDEFAMNTIVRTVKSKPKITWSRREAQKKLKLVDFHNNNDFCNEEIIQELSKNIKALERVCGSLIPGAENEEKCSQSDDGNDNDYPDATDELPGNCCDDISPTDLLEVNNSTESPSPEESDRAREDYNAWGSTIMNKINADLNSQPFDLKVTERNVMGVFEGRQTLNFSDISSQFPAKNIARYFLTVLELANKSNVIIHQPPALSVGDFKISVGPAKLKEGVEGDVFK